MPSKKTSQQAVPEQSLLLVTIPEAARRLSTTTWAIRELLWNKKVPHIKIGRRFLIRPADLASFVEREMGAAR